MDREYCIKCASHYMNGDDEWCDHYDTYCEDVEDNCEYYERWDY